MAGSIKYTLESTTRAILKPKSNRAQYEEWAYMWFTTGATSNLQLCKFAPFSESSFYSISMSFFKLYHSYLLFREAVIGS
jgi:hypothetical protein